MGTTWSQFFPPSPVFTEKECGDLSGKVFIVTGGASGVGRELVNLLFSNNGIVYIAARSKAKAQDTIAWCRAEHPGSTGRVEFLYLDLDDLTGIKASADEFMAKETRLDVLWNNAGVMVPPGYELQLGTNCLGHFLFTQKLLPILTRTAETAPKGSVRVAWAGSLVIDLGAPSGGIDMENITWSKKAGSQRDKYAQSKVGNMFLASEFAKRDKHRDVIHVAFNPGNLKSPLQRHISRVAEASISWMLHHPRFGAYTELFAGLSPEIKAEQTGSYIIPWGRISVPRKDLLEAMRSREEGGSGIAAAFWSWCETETAKYDN
ncbi:uncharacterized protein BHQ10_009539 [Talaromyces amestolkiae]|uniref:NAD(P)-binding protein n=1 Tax=Talaromyces amestolkiae TaxID=1196081 RepID=A0A364LCL3_TALAM|nr:uncharacterized protein BHQ10_009539 [Talaromyces amestolkiae]RAO73527.1 hypothetical protein BHQ10_009539 [Talaromyces amestolkiae]